MSSRSLAAARSRRAGENTPPVSGNRPGTSIGFQQAPAQVNVRVAKPQMQQFPQQQQQQFSQQFQQQPPLPPNAPNSNGLPFTKLSISDAIGLITIRLGRVEQWIIETDHENEQNEQHQVGGTIDNSIFTTFANRLDSLEKREITSGGGSGPNLEVITKLSEDFAKMNDQLSKIVEEASKHSIQTAKHTEQLFRFERELVETKDILKTFMLKYDQYTNETNNKFGDFEYAISEIEKNLPTNTEEETLQENKEQPEMDKIIDTNDDDDDADTNSDKSIDPNGIMSTDLKNLIKQEFTNFQ
jgi:hypothetical protein